ncbi:MULTISPECIES: O-antigen ligase [Thermoactinomyces]|uniref:O-antigen ligase family protein n=1 Tax=Thermoactinomyces daqus TaxID=1329516 RepID=A0A7W1X832_9BACL|nr:O-antigen ligase family protein [Thermoactinomyces daqus]MBA4541806.1 O-antigen ligase family protein [Thermoactinomyces daqus]MBH8597803.1 O-antigen ligase family protein [Thermoactinomyces sp. CICC 10523]MBH8604154.1 O-antigen ligase family protein [Thermoactinomyces sp. CICC 10522]MBH8608124.1 O-antigen ligase family protein [Thermoactinomyces sp. CICC 10521]
MSELLFPRQKRLETLFYLMIVFALLGPSFGVPVADFRLTFFRVAFVLLAAGFVLRLVGQKQLAASHMMPVRWYVTFFAFWFLYGVVSLAWVMNYGYAVRYLSYLVFMMPLSLAFPYFIDTEQKFWKTSRILFWVFASIVFFGVFESITLLHLPTSAVFGKASASVTTVFRNQNDFASCITIALPFLISALYMLNLKRKHKWFIYITGILALYDLMATGSRSNTSFALPLASLVLVVGLTFVMERKRITKKNLATALIAIIAAVITVNVLSQLFLSPEAREQAKTKLSSTFGFIMDVQHSDWSLDDGSDDVVKGETGESATVRKYLILNGLRFLQESHYMGVGAGNVEAWMDKYGVKVNKVNIHNWWAEILVNFGVIVFVLYMALYVWMLWRLWKLASLKHSPSLSPVMRWGAYSCLASLTGFFFGAMAPSTCIGFTPMWVIYGLSLAVIVVGENQKAAKTQ